MIKTKVYFPGAYGVSSKKITIWYRKLLSSTNETIEIVDDVKECDYVIMQDQTDENLPEDKQVIFFQKEPDHVKHYTYDKATLYKSFYHSKGEGWMIQTPWLSMSHDELVEMPPPPKRHLISVVDSGRTALPGHHLRLHALNDIIKHVPNIHLYGHITKGRENTGHFKTCLPERTKEAAFLDYKYAVAIENGRTPCYFSEKIIDPILCWTTPIYWGCSNISKYFPKGSFVEIKGLEKDVGSHVEAIIESKHHEENMDALAEARDLILNKYNLIPTIEKALVSNNLWE